MVMKEIDCFLPHGMNRKDAEAAIPKLMTGLGEIVAKAGDSTVFGPMGLSTIKYILLHVLDEHQARPTMTDLRKKLLRSPANLTQLVDDLEEQALIRRVASETDRRVKCIELTDAGRVRLKEAEAALAEQMERFFEDYTDDEVTGFLSLLIRFGNDMSDILGFGEDFYGPEA